MDPLVKKVAERVVHEPLPLDPRLAGEGGAFDAQGEMGFAGGIVAAMPTMLLAVVDEVEQARLERALEAAAHLGRDGSGGRGVHRPYIGRLAIRGSMALRQTKWHGRVEGAEARCAVPGCCEPGEFRAPLSPSSFDGPGDWRWLCLDHVREHNARYNFFEGMSAEEIEAAQSPLAGWDRSTRAFTGAGADPAPAWSDFRDPLDAIAGRFGTGRARAPSSSRFSGEEQRALSVLGLGQDSDLHAVRARYSELVRRYHPDRNGGDRRHEGKLGEVIAAWQTLRKATAFT